MTRLFQSYFLGGFECSTHRRRDRRRLDLIHATKHGAHAEQDYLALKRHGIHAVRDGVRWHMVECFPGSYDWSSFLPMLKAAQGSGMQPIWDLCHYGWPDHIDIWKPEFVDRFARFAAAFARLLREETDGPSFYCPINEISFWSWAGGDVALFNPATRRRGMELKCQLVRAAIAAVDAIRQVDPTAKIVNVDPVIHVVPKAPRYRKQAERVCNSQYEAWDMLAGTLMPELGGGSQYTDIMGLNYYSDNQWVLNGDKLECSDARYRPFREILANTYSRYRKPLFVAETGAEGVRRAPWLRYVCDEVHAAREAGVPVGGICLYPITDYPGWANNRHCHSGLLGMVDHEGARPVHDDLAQELFLQQKRFPCAAESMMEMSSTCISASSNAGTEPSG